MGIEIRLQDITSLKVEAIVNAANKSLLGGGGVDGAIHLAAGPQLQEACRALNGCEVGQAKITPGFNLSAKWVIHTVGPIWQGGTRNEHALLAKCYERVLQLAVSKNIHCIAFPAISTGIYGFPKRAAAKIALEVLNRYVMTIDEIIVCLFSEEDMKIYRELITEINRKSPNEDTH